MREISLHILDVMQNSIEAEASRIDLLIEQDTMTDSLVVTVADNGRGMDEAYAKAVLDPFVTSRRTRRVGLGLPLLKASAERSGGTLRVESQVGKGTTVTATFGLSNIDRPPMGNLKDTLLSVIVANANLDVHYEHRVDGEYFELDTAEIKRVVGADNLNDLSVIKWLSDYLDQDPKEVA